MRSTHYLTAAVIVAIAADTLVTLAYFGYELNPVLAAVGPAGTLTMKATEAVGVAALARAGTQGWHRVAVERALAAYTLAYGYVLTNNLAFILAA